MIFTDSLDMAFAGIPAADTGQVDRLLCDLAIRLERDGVRLAGAVQSDIERQGECRCDMSLRILSSDNRYPISARLGPLSRGCQLDPEALECAAWEVESLLRSASNNALPQLLIVNKFSKSEAHGKGFATCIAVALERGVSVLCGIGRLSLADFQGFTDDQAELLKPNKQAIEQ
ncbi:DUF2478 domain-containing protein [Granulosicoccus antarcticus]|uniref:DUF2478 domain-containing protein n=1 Tax=Granulosicoccus antarcticus TaxID=437505 RepID=UPI0012FD792B|nr:DUF2478 domain-containing protein [Granulosicoccus antarcticus]